MQKTYGILHMLVAIYRVSHSTGGPPKMVITSGFEFKTFWVNGPCFTQNLPVFLNFHDFVSFNFIIITMLTFIAFRVTLIGCQFLYWMVHFTSVSKMTTRLRSLVSSFSCLGMWCCLRPWQKWINSQQFLGFKPKNSGQLWSGDQMIT